MKSIIEESNEECFICGRQRFLENHHIFGASDRNKSTRWGMMVTLCHYCHNEPPNGVHHNPVIRNQLKCTAQRKFEERWGHDKFMEIFGRNYL